MTTIKSYWLPIIVALFLGFIIFYPNFKYLNIVSRMDFKGVYPVLSDDEITYEARIQEVLDGHISLGNAYLKEHENDPFLQPSLAEWVYAGILKVTGISVPTAMIAGDFLLPLIGYLGAYALFLQITKKKSLSVFYSSLFFLLFLKTFGRPISPQFNILFLFAGLSLIYGIYSDTYISRKRTALLSGLLGAVIGITLFISPYYWTALLVVCFLVVAAKTFTFTQKDFLGAKKTLIIFSLSFVPFLLLYLFFTVKAHALPGYADAMVRFGLINSRWPGTYSNIFLGLIAGIALWFNYRHVDKTDARLAGCFVLSIFILNYQNVITGQHLQFSSHYLMYTVLSLLLVLAVIHKSWLALPAENVKKFALIGIAIIPVVIVFLMYQQRSEVFAVFAQKVDRAEIVKLQEKARVFDWLNQHTSPSSVVYSLGGDYDYWIPVYTKNKVYHNLYASFFVVPQQEIENRWLIQNIFNPQFDSRYIVEHQREIWGNRFIDPYSFVENRRKLFSVLAGGKYIPRARIDTRLTDELLLRFGYFKKMPLRDALKTYEIDYILLSSDYPHFKQTRQILDKLPFVRAVATSTHETIYEID